MTEPNLADSETHDIAADLLGVLRRRLDLPDLDYAEPPTPLGGGFWAEILAVSFTGAPSELSGDLVARVMPDDLFGRRETVIQREVAAQGFPAPTVRLAGDSDDGLGHPYMLMDRSRGVPLLSGLSGARAIASIPRLVRRLPRLLASTSLELHLLDAAPVAAALRTEVPDAPVDTTEMVARLRDAATQLEVPHLVHATEWLAAHQPEPERVSVCHGDLHPINLLVDDLGQVTLVDWTASYISEPAFDLAFTTLMIREAPLDVPGPLIPVVRRAAGWLAGKVLSTYRQLGEPHGIVVDDERFAWHTALACTRVLSEYESWGPGERPGHPFVGMAGSLRSQLEAITRS